MMFSFLFNKRLIGAAFLCGLQILSLPCEATVITLPGPPPKTKLITTTTYSGGKWVTTVDPDGIEAFSLDFEFNPSRVGIDLTAGINGVSFLFPYDHTAGSIPTIEVVSPTSAFIRDIAGHLQTGQSPTADMFTIAFNDIISGPSTFQFKSFANNLSRTAPKASYMDVISGDVTTRIWGDTPGAITEGISTCTFENGNGVCVPEPSTVALLTVGLVGMSAYRVSRRKKQVA